MDYLVETEFFIPLRPNKPVFSGQLVLACPVDLVKVSLQVEQGWSFTLLIITQNSIILGLLEFDLKCFHNIHGKIQTYLIRKFLAFNFNFVGAFLNG